MVPAQASLVGAHQFSGAGVPENFRFQLGAEQDLMPALMLQQQEAAGATELAWNAAPTARGYFVSAMGAGGREEMVLWTSSEQPDTGFGLADYQTNAAVDRWLREKVLLAPNVTRCTVPAGIFSGGGAMLRLTGYGNEVNLAFPPRPTDVRQRWDPDWAVKLRVKSVASAMLGMPGAGLPGSAQGEREGQAPQDAAQDSKPKPLEILRGIFGR
jgi:hypothetical protein